MIVRVVNDIYANPDRDVVAIYHTQVEDLESFNGHNWKKLLFIVESGEIPYLRSKAIVYRKSDNSIFAFHDNLSECFFGLDYVINCERLVLYSCFCYFVFGERPKFNRIRELVLRDSFLEDASLLLLAPLLEIIETDSVGQFLTMRVPFPKLIEYRGSNAHLTLPWKNARYFPMIRKFGNNPNPQPWKSDGTPADASWVILNSVGFYHNLMVSARVSAIFCLTKWRFPKDIIKLICRQISIDWFFDLGDPAKYLDKLAGLSYSDFENLEPMYQKLRQSESLSRYRILDIQERRQKIKKLPRSDRGPWREKLEQLEDYLAETEAVVEASRAFIKTYLKRRKL